MAESEKLALVSNIAASYLRRNSVSIDQIGTVVSSVTRAIEQAAREIDGSANPGLQPSETGRSPAVPIKKSVHRQYIVCLEDGLRARTLKRHLNSAHRMTPDQYRAKWGLPDDYPLVAPAYSESRSKMAKKLGLGRTARAAIARPKRRGPKSTVRKF
jgi:predicted transcriptional regulator